MQERRKTDRLFPNTRLKIFDDDRDELLGHIADFSDSGLMMISRQRVPAGETFNLRIQVPTYRHSVGESRTVPTEKTFYVKVKSIWCEADKFSDDLLATGFEFVDVSEESINFLIDFFGIQSQ